MKCNLKWTNKYSNETGYVGKVLKSKGYFINATKEEAKKYASEKTALKDIEVLTQLGEAENNEFTVEAIEA